jgi:hypothetical protein
MDNDFCTPDGARRLKQRIEDYWRDKGYAVDVKLVEAGFVPAMRSARFDVRSDLVNGIPRANTAPSQPSGQRRDYASSSAD